MQDLTPNQLAILERVRKDRDFVTVVHREGFSGRTGRLNAFDALCLARYISQQPLGMCGVVLGANAHVLRTPETVCFVQAMVR